MTDPTPTPLQQTVSWLTAHAGFPARRLPEKAELLLLMASAAAEGEREMQRESVKAKIPFSPNHNARLRSYTIQRRHAHVKSDNSAKT